MNNEMLVTLKKSRESVGLTQKDVEHKLEMRKLMMRDYEIGRLKLPVTVAKKLATLYKVSLDELLGHEDSEMDGEAQSVLTNFNALFTGNGFSLMFLDPILRAYLEDHYEDYFRFSLFDLLTKSESSKFKKTLLLQISSLLMQLASSDQKICDAEITCLKNLLSSFGLQSKFSQLNDQSLDMSEIPATMKKIEIRHFIIWMLFFFAKADGNICYQEIDFIEQCAEKLRVNRSNFKFIKEKFIGESE